MVFAFRFRTGVIAVVLFVLGAAADVTAGEWRVVPRFSIGENYSDNVRLQNFNEQEDFITRATPGLSVRGTGRRVQLNLDYNLQNLTYANDSTRNTINHQLQSGASIEVLRKVFFLDADASCFQALVSNTGTISDQNFTANNNQGDVLTYSVSPRFQHHFGSWADMRASTSFSDTIGFGSGGTRTAGSGNGINLSTSLSSGRKFTRTSWSVSNNRRLFNNDSGASSSSRSRWNASGSVNVNRFFRMNGSVGWENNDFSGPGNGSGVTWNVGATLTPSRRSSLTGSYGHRTFGSTKSFSFNHRRRRISISGSYSESLSTTNDQLRDQQLISLADPFGQPVFDPFSASDIANPLGTLSRTDDVFVSRDFNATVGYSLRRDSFSANVYRRESDGGATSQAQSAIGTSTSWSHTFSQRLSGGISVSYRNGSGGGIGGSIGGGFGGGFGGGGVFRNPNLQSGGSDTEVFSVTPNMSYSIGPHTSGNFSYSFTTSSSKDPGSGYTENSLSGSLSFAF